MKAYEKPRIRIEYLNLSKHIASCSPGTVINQEATNVCIADVDDEKSVYYGMRVFVSSNTDCDVQEDIIDVYCYTNGSSELNLLGS